MKRSRTYKIIGLFLGCCCCEDNEGRQHCGREDRLPEWGGDDEEVWPQKHREAHWRLHKARADIHHYGVHALRRSKDVSLSKLTIWSSLAFQMLDYVRQLDLILIYFNRNLLKIYTFQEKIGINWPLNFEPMTFRHSQEYYDLILVSLKSHNLINIWNCNANKDNKGSDCKYQFVL